MLVRSDEQPCICMHRFPLSEVHKSFYLLIFSPPWFNHLFWCPACNWCATSFRSRKLWSPSSPDLRELGKWGFASTLDLIISIFTPCLSVPPVAHQCLRLYCHFSSVTVCFSFLSPWCHCIVAQPGPSCLLLLNFTIKGGIVKKSY